MIKFKENDVLYNRVKLKPHKKFVIYDGVVYYSDKMPTDNLGIYAYVTKDGTLHAPKSVTTASLNSDYDYGDEVTGSSISYYSASLARNRYAANTTRAKIDALKNTINYYKPISQHFQFSSSLGNKATQEISVIDIPAIFYGSKIEKGTIEMNFYVSGTLVGTLKDHKSNGELIQTYPQGAFSGSVAGICLYREGLLVLTGSWDLTDESFDFNNDSNAVSGSWINWGSGIEGDNQGVIDKISYGMKFSGSQVVPTVTMFCHALEGELNYSSNPTFLSGNQLTTASYDNESPNYWREPAELKFKNVSSTDYNDPTGSFSKTTYITKINVYDERGNVLGVAKLAKPIKKTEDRSFTFKLKTDI